MDTNALDLSFTSPWRHPSHSPQQALADIPFSSSHDEYIPNNQFTLMSSGNDSSSYSTWHPAQTMTPMLSTPISTHSHGTPSSSGSYISHPGSSRMQTLQLSPISPIGESMRLNSYPHSPSTRSGHWSSSAASSPASHEGGNSGPSVVDPAHMQYAAPVVPHNPERQLTKIDAANLWRNVGMDPRNGTVIPQLMYRPHTQSDRRRYVEEVSLQEPIYFYAHNELGISLPDVLHSRVKHLEAREETVFHGRGPSVSIRLEVRGYHRQRR